MRLKYHSGRGHRNERIDSGAKWKAKKRLVTMASWIIGALLIACGLYLMFSDSGTFKHVIGGLIFLAGALLIGFSREMRNWILMKW